MAMGAVGDLVVRLGAQTRQFDSRMRRSTGVVRVMTGAVYGLGSAIMTALGPVVGVYGLIKLTTAGETFNRKMRQSLAIMGDVSEAMRKDMRDAAFAAARSTRFAASEAAEAFYFLASAGLSAKQSIAAMPAVATFAAAGNFDLARATDILTDAQSALGLASKDAAVHLQNMNRVSDVTVAAASEANASVEQFGEALMNKGALGAKLVGMELEQAMAILMVFADKGFAKGVEGGSALWMALRDLKTKAVENQAAFKRLGINVDAGGGSFNNMASIVEDLDRAFVGLEPLEVQKKLAALGLPSKSLAPILTLLGTADQLRQYQKYLADVGGTAKRVADDQMTPLQEGWAKLGATMTKVGADIMEWAGPILGRAMSRFAGWFKFIRAGFSLLSDLVKSTADFFSAAWEVSIRFASNQFGSFGDTVADVFKGIIDDMDVLLGSWQGFNELLYQGASQTVLAIQSAWAGFTLFFEYQTAKWIEVGKNFYNEWLRIVAKGAIELYAPRTLSVEQRRGLFDLVDIGFDQKRKSIEAKTNAKVEAMRKAHEDRLAILGQASLDLSEEWKKKLAELPTLSENFRDKLKKINEELEKSILPELAAVPDIPGAGAQAGGVGGKMFGAAKERGSAEAWSAIMKAMGGGKKGPEEKTAKNTEEIARKQGEANQILRDIADGGGNVTEIPPA